MKIELPDEFYNLNLKEQERYLSEWYINLGVLENMIFKLLASIRGGNLIKKDNE